MTKLTFENLQAALAPLRSELARIGARQKGSSMRSNRKAGSHQPKRGWPLGGLRAMMAGHSNDVVSQCRCLCHVALNANILQSQV